MNQLLVKSYTAAAAIAASRIVKMASADLEVIQATDESGAFAGVSVENIATASGGKVDVVKAGLADVVLGDTVARGAWLTSDADGKAVAASIVPGEEVHVIGVAEVSGVAGDIIPMLVCPAVIATDTGIVSADVTIATGELLALNATPKDLVPAPGAGKANILVDAQAFLDYNSAAYAGIAAGEDIAIRYTDGSGAIVAEIEATGFLDLTADAYRHVYPLADAAKVPVANAKLVAHMKAGEVITGDSPLKLRVRYRVIDLAF